MPTPGFERARLLERLPLPGFVESSDAERASENRIAREYLFTEAIARGAREVGIATLVVDESRSLDETSAAVEKRLAPALVALPRAAGRAERSALLRDENATIIQQLRLYAAAHPAAGPADEMAYAFACECGTSGCDATVRLAVSEYEHAGTAVVPAHVG